MAVLAIALPTIDGAVGVADHALADPATGPGVVTKSTAGALGAGTVPDGTCYAKVTAVGGGGASSPTAAGLGGTGGAGASISATFAVVPGQSYGGTVGAGGTVPNGGSGTGAGGNGGTIVNQHQGGGGGGGTTVTLAGQTAVVAGGGGGGGAAHQNAPAGAGGAGGTSGIGAGTVAAGNAGQNGVDAPYTAGGGQGGQNATGGSRRRQLRQLGPQRRERWRHRHRHRRRGRTRPELRQWWWRRRRVHRRRRRRLDRRLLGHRRWRWRRLELRVAATSPVYGGPAPTAISGTLGVASPAGSGSGATGSVSIDWIPCRYDLDLTKTVSSPTVNAGGKVTWTVSVTNNGPNVMTKRRHGRSSPTRCPPVRTAPRRRPTR